jgi:hypothetical protein
MADERIHAKIIPMMLCKGVAPDGTEHDMLGFGNWIEEEEINSLPLYKRSKMTADEVRSFWQWANRKPPIPPSLKLYVSANPEFRDWITLTQAGEFVSEKLGGDDAARTRACDLLQRAFRQGQIRTRGVHMHDKRGRVVSVENIQINTRDLVKWLAYELDIKTTVNVVACWPKDATIMEALFPVGKKRPKHGRGAE